MAIARLGSIVGAISGNLNSVTFTNRKHGLTICHRPLKRNPRTTDQLEERNQMQRMVSVWKTLTAAEYLEWKSLAEKVPRTNRLGVTSRTTPFQVFVRMNKITAYLGITIQTTPYLLGHARACKVKSILFTEGGPYTIRLEELTPYTSGETWVYGHRPMRTSPTRGIRTWKFLGRVPFDGDDPQNLWSWWTPRLGELVTGEFVHLKLICQTVGGINNPPHTVTTTVVAP